MSYDPSAAAGIGDALKNARRRLGMDIKEAEDRTKIRTRYLRALEAEDWEALPAPAYVRGFLRVYGQILGLDGEMLADRYRRSYEEPAAFASAAAEPVLKNRRRPQGSRPPSRGPWVIVVAVAIVVLLVILAILGLTAGNGEDSSPRKNALEGNRDVTGRPNNEKSTGQGSPAGLKPVALTIEPLSEVRVCLVGDSRNALVDSQVLTVGAVEEFNGELDYRLDLAGGGTVKLQVGDEEQELAASDDASFEADSRGITEINYAGPNCP